MIQALILPLNLRRTDESGPASIQIDTVFCPMVSYRVLKMVGIIRSVGGRFTFIGRPDGIGTLGR